LFDSLRRGLAVSDAQGWRKFKHLLAENAWHWLGGAIVGALAASLTGLSNLQHVHSYLAARSSSGLALLVIALFFIVILILVMSITLYIKNTNRANQTRKMGLCDVASFDHLSEQIDKYQARKDFFHQYRSDFLASSRIDMLLASGYQTIARDGQDGQIEAPLRFVFENAPKKGKIRVLLADPDSKFSKERCKTLYKNENQYAEDINKALSFLKGKKNAGLDVEVHIYSRPLIWKLIVVDNLIFQQTYPEEDHGDFTAVKVFEKLPKEKLENGLHHPFSIDPAL
jgi:uncharacterized C2H2 Zn-finger protein